jgi:CpXC protein
MSLSRPAEIDCPECQHSQKVVVWDSLNVDVTPDEKQELLEGRINVFHCEQCGHSGQIVMPFMYHDMGRQFCVLYQPLELLEDKASWAIFDPNGMTNVGVSDTMPGPDYMRHIHVVFQMSEPVRYVVFRERLFGHYSGTTD